MVEVAASSRQQPITFVSRYYPPAYLAGGPPRSVAAMVSSLRHDTDARVITSSFDLGKQPLSVETDRWTGDRSRIFYASDALRAFRQLRKTLKSSETTVVHVNSLFDPVYGTPAAVVGLISGVRTVIAPRGELAEGALGIKPKRKRLALALFRLVGLHRRIVWHATAEREQRDICAAFGPDIRCHLAPMIRPVPEQPPTPPKSGAETRIVFFSRVAPVKNVLAAIDVISHLEGATLTIAGPIDDDVYAAQCRARVEALGLSDRVVFVGAIDSDDAVGYLSEFDLMLLPTLGENFGHAIFESLAAGTPVVIADTTPWVDVNDAGAGFICDVGDPGEFINAVRSWQRLDAASKDRMRTSARSLAERQATGAGVEANMKMLIGDVR